MGFDSEQRMKEVAIPALQTELFSDSVRVVDEFEYGSGIADLVFSRESDIYRSRREEELGIKSAIRDDSCLRAFLRLHSKGKISRDYFIKLGAESRRVKEDALDWLIAHNFAQELDDGKVRTAPDLRRHVTTAYDIELKLSKWQQALKQARRGKCFSDYQFVVLDEEYVLRAINHLDLFEEYNVGLLSIDTEGSVQLHNSPEKQTPFSYLNKWKLNETTILTEDKMFS